MNMHNPPKLTEAETALFRAFDAADFADQSVERAAAMDALRATGLPTRRIEAFHYTDLRSLLRGAITLPAEPSAEASEEIGAAFPRLINDACVIHFRDGWHYEKNETLPDGVSCEIGLPAPAIEDRGSANTVALLNAGLARSGAKLIVEKDANVSRTIGLAYAHTGAPETFAGQRMAIMVGENATCRFVERGVGRNEVAYTSSCVVDLEIAAGANVTYILSNEEGDAATRLARLSVRLEAGASLNLFVLNVGGKVVRQELDFTILGDGAELTINGANLVGGEAHIDVTSSINHLAPNATATEVFRNVATGHGSGVFQGQIKVDSEAQKTDARMACNTLLLSDNAEFSAKPELEIFADDVQCAHGATVADLEDAYMFYLRARGISETRARQMLVRAFVAEVIEELEDEELVEALEARMDAWMETHV